MQEIDTLELVGHMFAWYVTADMCYRGIHATVRTGGVFAEAGRADSNARQTTSHVKERGGWREVQIVWIPSVFLRQRVEGNQVSVEACCAG